MTDAKFTRTKWKRTGKYTVRSETGDLIAKCNWKNGEEHAALIAAAPELYEALQVAIKAMRRNIEFALYKDERAIADALPVALAAIAKADRR